VIVVSPLLSELALFVELDEPSEPSAPSEPPDVAPRHPAEARPTVAAPVVWRNLRRPLCEPFEL